MRMTIERRASTAPGRVKQDHRAASFLAADLRKRIDSGKLSPEKRAKFEDALGIIAPEAEALGRRAKLSAE